MCDCVISTSQVSRRRRDQIRANMQVVRIRNVSRHALIGSVVEAREVNVVCV